MPELPTEIIERIFVSLMESFNGYDRFRKRSAKFAQLSINSRLFHSVTKRNGYYYADTGEKLFDLWTLLGDEEAVAGMKDLTLQGNSATDLLLMRKVLLVAGSAPKLRQLRFTFDACDHSGELEQYHRQRGSVMDALEGLKNIEIFVVDCIGFPYETALCR